MSEGKKEKIKSVSSSIVKSCYENYCQKKKKSKHKALW